MPKFLHPPLMIALIAHLFLGIASVRGQTDKEQFLHWHGFDAPPIMIRSGPNEDKGIIDIIRQMLQKEMTNVEHSMTALPYKRFHVYAQNGVEICTPYLFKTAERETYLYFSRPVALFNGIEAILHRSTYDKLGQPKSVSLEKLFRQKLELITNSVRAYTPAIDQILKDEKNKSLVRRRSGSTTQVFKLLSAQRADFMLDFPNRIAYWTEALKLNRNDFISLPIEENNVQKHISYIACPKTPWGKSTITAINQALEQVQTRPEYLDALLLWSDEKHQNFLRQKFQEAFKSQ